MSRAQLLLLAGLQLQIQIEVEVKVKVKVLDLDQEDHQKLDLVREDLTRAFQNATYWLHWTTRT